MNISPISKSKSYLKGFFLRHIPGMITCQQFDSFIADYYEGSLPPAQLRTFERHLRLCRECREYLAAYKRTIELGQAVFLQSEAALPENIPDDLVRAILAASETR